MFRKSIFAVALVLGPITAFALPALAQTASYTGGSIYDLAPPMQQATGSRHLEALILSKRQHRMKEIRDYAPNDTFRVLARPVGRLALTIDTGSGQQGAYCTASLIASDLILTNHHCVPGNGNVEAAILTVGYLKPRSTRSASTRSKPLRISTMQFSRSRAIRAGSGAL